jgi:nitrogen regulatory protein PII
MGKFKLIVTICNHGFSEEIMDSAKQEGRSTAIHEETKFFGIKIHPEKDVILIVAKKEDVSKLMNAITKNHGMGKDAHALCFSVPIDETIGFNL